MLSPMSRGLFDRAISQSGTANAPWALNENPAGQAKKFAKNLGCLTKQSDELVDCLRTKSAHDILALRFQANLFNPTGLNLKSDYFLPVIEAVKDENAFLAEHPKEILEDGKSAKVLWLTGINSAEGLLPSIPFVVSPRFRKQLDQNWDKLASDLLFASSVPNNGSNYEKIWDFYFGGRHLTSLSVLPDFMEMMTDRFFLVSLVKAINEHAKVAPVFAYYFTKNGPLLYKTRTRVDSKFPSLIKLARAQLQTWIDAIGNRKSESGSLDYDEMCMLSPLPSLEFIGKHHLDFEFSKDMVQLWVSFASGRNKTLSFRGLEFVPVEPTGNPVLFEINDEPQQVSLDIHKRVTLWDGFEGIIGQK